MHKNGLDKKIRLVLNLITLQLGKQAILIHILPSISRLKGSQTVKFGQLNNMRNIFLEK